MATPADSVVVPPQDLKGAYSMVPLPAVYMRALCPFLYLINLC